MKIRQKRLIKKLISISLTLFTIASLAIPMCISSFAAENTTHFAGGSGTKYNPYRISNTRHFNNIRKYADDNAYFEMVSDIEFDVRLFDDYEGEYYNNGLLWLPIENFNGYFDGGGYLLDGIETTNAIFGTNTGKIENLEVYVRSYRTGLCTENYGTINNCFVRFYIDPPGYYDNLNAGITCINYGAISNCKAMGSISSDEEAAGICLKNYGLITYSQSSIRISGNIGVSSGITNENYGTISYCSNVHSISSLRSAAGIAYRNDGLISDCYNSGSFEFTSPFAKEGAISSINNGSIINCYNLGFRIYTSYGKDTIYNSSIVLENNKCVKNCYSIKKSGEEYTDEQMQKEETYKGFDFGGVWKIDTSSDYKYPQIITTDATVESIEIVDGSPDRFTSKLGLYADISELSLKVNYSDGTDRVMKGSPFMLKKFDINKLGEQTAPLYFGGKLTDKQITINASEKEMSSISVTQMPKTTYVQGQPLDLKNGLLTLYYDDYSSESVAFSKVNVSYDKTLIGTVPVTVEFMGLTTQFDITVNKRAISSMVFTEPDKLVYNIGEQLDLTNGKLSIVFKSTDNYSEDIPLTPEMVSGYDPYKLGEQTVTVTYLNAIISFDVKVLPDKGDVNCDGKVNVVDATEIQKYIINKDALSQMGVSVADVNGDGAINVADATLIQKYVVGFVDSLG